MRSGLRLALLLFFAVFWGGLTFYTGIVVRIAHRVLEEDSMTGGLITQQVTHWLQWLGVATGSLMAINGVVVLQRSQWFGAALLTCTLVLAVSLAGLFVVHGNLDAVIDAPNHEITDEKAFTINHRRYNQLTTVEWLSSLAYLALAVAAWKRVDESGAPADLSARPDVAPGVG